MTEPAMPGDIEDRSIDRPARLIVYTLFLIGSVTYSVEATTFHPLARVAPLVVGVGASLLMFMALMLEIWRWQRSRRGANDAERVGSIEATESPLTIDSLLPALKYIGVVVAYVISIALFGFLLSSVALLVALLRIVGGMRWASIGVSLVILVVAYWSLRQFAGLTFPTGILDLA